MKPDKYILHDVYHVIQNYTIIKEGATRMEINGALNKTEYTPAEITQCIQYLINIGMVQQGKDGKYRGISL